MKLRILNDRHIGAVRSAGTTPTTQCAIREHLIDSLKRDLPIGGDLMILGDIFDKEFIPLIDLRETYRILSRWLADNALSELWLVAGNHDLSKSSNILSSFDFLGYLLENPRCHFVKEMVTTRWGVIIPHVPNQDLFNLALDSVPDCKCLFLHCNYDNGFAAQSDHSLNLSREQAEACKAEHIIIAHEHHARSDGKVILPGNQSASSVSDWLSNSDKYFLDITYEPATEGSFKIEKVKCADRESSFVDFDWRDGTKSEAMFLRVSGRASPEEASAVVSYISRLRQSSTALAISSAVRIESEDTTKLAADSLESIQAFSVQLALRELLTARQLQIIESVGELNA